MKPKPIKHKELNTISRPTNLVLSVLFTMFSLLCVIPVLIVISSSLTSDTTILLNGYSIVPKKPDFASYVFVFSDQGRVIRAYVIQILTTVVGTTLSALITAMIAYPLSRKELPFRNFFSFFVFFTILFSGGLAPTYFVYTNILHLKNTFLILFVPYLVGGFNVIILRTFFSTSVPVEIIESAKMDGAGEFRTFFQMVWPIALPGIATVALFTTIGLWNDWFLSMLYIDREALTNLQYMMYKTLRMAEYIKANANFRNSYGNDVLARLPVESSRMAMAIIGMAPIMVAYPFFQRYFIKGLTIGSIKG